jgi:hypothetical protein
MQGLCWFIVLFISPTLLAVLNAWLIQRGSLAPLYRLLRLRPISPIPTGWDWIFSTTEPCFLLVTLKDGTEIAGYFGRRSMASSDPEHKDLYVERVYKIPQDKGEWIEVDRSLGWFPNSAYRVQELIEHGSHQRRLPPDYRRLPARPECLSRISAGGHQSNKWFRTATVGCASPTAFWRVKRLKAGSEMTDF